MFDWLFPDAAAAEPSGLPGQLPQPATGSPAGLPGLPPLPPTPAPIVPAPVTAALPPQPTLPMGGADARSGVYNPPDVLPPAGASLGGPPQGGADARSGVYDAPAESARAQAPAAGGADQGAKAANLLAALRGVVGPQVPAAQRVATPHQPQRAAIRGGELLALLEGLRPVAQGYRPPTYPSTLGAALGGR